LCDLRRRAVDAAQVGQCQRAAWSGRQPVHRSQVGEQLPAPPWQMAVR
jgi:hypothetical protein